MVSLGILLSGLFALASVAQEVQPVPSPPFKGVIKLDVRDSTPDWAPFTPKAARRGHRTSCSSSTMTPALRLVALRRPDQHADARQAGGERPDVHAVAHDGAVLADPVHAPDRAQPPPERHGRHHGGRQRLPGGARSHSRRSAPRSAQILQDNGYSTFWLGKNHNVPSRTSPRARAASCGRSEGLRPLLRIPRRRDQPVVSGPRRGQPLHRAAVRPRAGLPPLQGPGRSRPSR